MHGLGVEERGRGGVKIKDPVSLPRRQPQLRVFRNERKGTGIVAVQVLDDDACLRNDGAAAVVSQQRNLTHRPGREQIRAGFGIGNVDDPALERVSFS